MAKKTKKPKKQWQAANRAEAEKAVGSDKFIHKKNCSCGFSIHTFLRPGEIIEGRLRPCDNHDRADRSKCGHIHYYTKTGNESVIAIRMSKIIWDAVDKETNEKPRLWGQWVRITYVGSEQTRFGHARKIYLVEYDKGDITPHFKRV